MIIDRCSRLFFNPEGVSQNDNVCHPFGIIMNVCEIYNPAIPSGLYGMKDQEK